MKPEARMGLAENQATPLTGIPPQIGSCKSNRQLPKRPEREQL